MISGQSLTCPKGASLTFEIDMDTGSDLTGATAQWALCESWFDNAKVYLTKTGVGDGLFIGQDAGVWKITVNLAPTDTLDIPSGLLYHDCKVLLQSGDVEDVANGPFSLDPSVNILDTNAPITRNLHAVQLLGRLGQTAPLTVAWLARNLLATQSFVGLGQSAAGTVTGGSVAPDFQADFTALSALPAQVSFSRASNAMVRDSTGNLTYAPNNLLLYSNDFTNAAWTASNVTLAPGQADPLGGTSATRVTAGANAAFVQQLGSFISACNAISSLYVRRVSGTGDIRILTPDGGGSSPLSLTSAWQRFSGLGLSRTGNMFSGVQISISGDVIDIAFAAGEQVTYETSPRDYNPTTSAVYYGPRFDHSWNGSAWIATGLLIEEQRTNLLKDSNNMGSANWFISGATFTPNTAVSPDGTTNAGTLAISGLGYVGRNSPILSGQVATCTAYVKQAPSGSALAIRLTTADAGVGFDTGTSTKITLTNTWQRLTTGFTAPSNTNVRYQLGSGDVSNNPDPDCIGNILVCFGQTEIGTFATSYIPTTTAAVTRSADIAQLTGEALTTLQGAAYSVIAEIDGALTDYAQIVATNSPLNTIIGHLSAGDQAYALGDTGFLTSVPNIKTVSNRIAVAADASSSSLVADGGTVATSANVVLSPVTAQIGGRSDGLYINAHIRSLAIYSSRLSDADLQAKSVVGAAF